MASEPSPVWFITGCSSGFGHELARLVLARGWRAVVTARDKARVSGLMSGAGDRALALDLDVTDGAQITAAVYEAETRFGRIDVLVNNAGYGYQASVEDGHPRRPARHAGPAEGPHRRRSTRWRDGRMRWRPSAGRSGSPSPASSPVRSARIGQDARFTRRRRGP
jgi:NAD(P)-dependent dehydrogenase (short-subunit alcohol dehydrogenase family)